MFDSTQVVRPVEQERTAEVRSLWTDVVLDDAAIEAERLALLAELTAERFDLAYVRGGERGNAKELAAARHLECGARLAREAADVARGRCAAVNGNASRSGDSMNDQQSERALVLADGRLESLVLDLVGEIHGDAAFERQARYDGHQYFEAVPVPLAGLWAANRLAQRANREVATHARRAREAGHSWDEIGQALGIERGVAVNAAEAAYERFAASCDVRGPSFVWRCPACDRVISDRGPYEGHPDDNQPGHANDCSRLAGELASWRSSFNAGTVQTRVTTTEQGMDL